MESGSFFINKLGFFQTSVMIIVLNLVAILVICVIGSKISMTKWVLNFFHFTAYIRMMIETYLFAVLAALSEIYRYENLNQHLTSNIISIIFLVF